MRAKSQAQLALDFSVVPIVPSPREETFDQALDATFPVAPMTEEELYQHFLRLFPG
jgi:hypothetical protein